MNILFWACLALAVASLVSSVAYVWHGSSGSDVALLSLCGASVLPVLGWCVDLLIVSSRHGSHVRDPHLGALWLFWSFIGFFTMGVSALTYSYRDRGLALNVVRFLHLLAYVSFVVLLSLTVVYI